MGQTIDIDKASRQLKKSMGSYRYNHTQGVRYTAAALAMCHGEDAYKAELAGLLHDCAKEIPDASKLKICEKRHIPVTEVEKENPFLLHAKLGAYLASEDYGVADEAVLSAITWHTTGRPAMSRLDQIVFIADYIEPHRNKSENLPQIRAMAFKDLDECCYMVLKDTLVFLKRKSARVDQHSRAAFEYYEEIHFDKYPE